MEPARPGRMPRLTSLGTAAGALYLLVSALIGATSAWFLVRPGAGSVELGAFGTGSFGTGSFDTFDITELAARNPALIVPAIVCGEVLLALLALTLRRVDRAVSLATVLFGVHLLSSAGLLALVVVADSPFDPELLSESSVLFAGAVGYLLLGIIATSRLSGDTRAHRRSITVYDELASLVFDEPRTTGFSRSHSQLWPEDHEEMANLDFLAEQLTAPLLAELLAMPGITVLENVRLPEGDGLVFGHAVVAGGRIAVVESVLWAPDDYTLDRLGRVVRSDGDADSHSVRLPGAVAAVVAAYPAVRIRGWTVVHPLSPGTLRVRGESESDPARLATADAMLREAGDWLAEEGDVINVSALAFYRGWRA